MIIVHSEVFQQRFANIVHIVHCNIAVKEVTGHCNVVVNKTLVSNDAVCYSLLKKLKILRE